MNGPLLSVLSGTTMTHKLWAIIYESYGKLFPEIYPWHDLKVKNEEYV